MKDFWKGVASKCRPMLFWMTLVTLAVFYISTNFSIEIVKLVVGFVEDEDGTTLLQLPNEVIALVSGVVGLAIGFVSGVGATIIGGNNTISNSLVDPGQPDHHGKALDIIGEHVKRTAPTEPPPTNAPQGDRRVL